MWCTALFSAISPRNADNYHSFLNHVLGVSALHLRGLVVWEKTVMEWGLPRLEIAAYAG